MRLSWRVRHALASRPPSWALPAGFVMIAVAMGLGWLATLAADLGEYWTNEGALAYLVALAVGVAIRGVVWIRQGIREGARDRDFIDPRTFD